MKMPVLLGCWTCFKEWGMDMPVTITCWMNHHDLVWGSGEEE